MKIDAEQGLFFIWVEDVKKIKIQVLQEKGGRKGVSSLMRTANSGGGESA